MAIYTFSPFRLLAICTSLKCEYCKEVVHPTASQGAKKKINTTHAVRPTFGQRVCWKCLNQGQPRVIPGCGDVISYSCLTTEWHKVHWDAGGSVDPVYMENRSALYDIWNHDRVLAYPGGYRELRETNFGESVPVLRERDYNDPDPFEIAESRDEFEIMWTYPRNDRFGARQGPIYTLNYQDQLLQYLRTEGNQGIDYFLQYIIPGVPSPEDYQPLVSTYKSLIDQANARQSVSRRASQAKIYVSWYGKTSIAVGAMAKIARKMTSANIERWSNESTLSSFPATFGEDRLVRLDYASTPTTLKRKTMIRLMLLYREIHYHHATWHLTFDTGDGGLNSLMHSVLGRYLRNPQPLTSGEALSYARTIYLATRGIVFGSAIPGIHLRHMDRIRTDFVGVRFRRPYRPRENLWDQPWTDPSENRSY